MPRTYQTNFTDEQLTLIKMLTLQTLKPYTTVSNPDKGIMYENLLILRDTVSIIQEEKSGVL